MNGGQVIARLQGGLGNQLFIYAAARRLAAVRGASLRLDTVSGFRQDHVFRRQYVLHQFNIDATPACRCAALAIPGGNRLRQALVDLNRCLPYCWRFYLKEEPAESGGLYAFDRRLVESRFAGPVLFLDGYWQSERYFADVQDLIRRDVTLAARPPPETEAEAACMRVPTSVAVCVRRYGEVPAPLKHAHRTLGPGFYRKAMRHVAAAVPGARFFVFGDDAEWAGANITGPWPISFVRPKPQNLRASEDLWLMACCRHHVISNSSLHWWGAWLGAARDGIVVAPEAGFNNRDTVPDRWIRMGE